MNRESPYDLCLGARVREYLIGAKSGDRNRLLQKFEFLREGLWDTGVRVKKLRGFGFGIFEARVDLGRRAIFTVGPSPGRPGRKAVLLWGISDHDDVEASARVIAAPNNARFMDSEIIEIFDYSELDLSSPGIAWATAQPIPRHDSVSAGNPDLSRGFDPVQGAGDGAIWPWGPQRWYSFDDLAWLSLVDSPKGHRDLFLHLSDEQRDASTADPPVLVSGTAGSGKTVISIYYLLRSFLENCPRLYLTCSPILRDQAAELYGSLAETLAAAGSRNPSGIDPVFMTFREICMDLVGTVNPVFAPEGEVDLRRFENLVVNHRHFDKFDSLILWEEIRGVIKGRMPSIKVSDFILAVERLRTSGPDADPGAMRRVYRTLVSAGRTSVGKKALLVVSDLLESCSARGIDERLGWRLARTMAVSRDRAMKALDRIVGVFEKSASRIEGAMMHFDDYVATSGRVAPNFTVSRREIHEVAQYYQDRLVSFGLWDAIDLAAEAAVVLWSGSRRLKGEKPPFSFAVVDEVQDLAWVQLALVMDLLNEPESVFMTGDIKQVINPSAFRWADVKERFFDEGRAAPILRHLGFNFRCSLPVSGLANEVMALKKELIGLRRDERLEEGHYSGGIPILVRVSPSSAARPEEASGLLALIGPHGIVASDETRRDRLRSALGTTLVFTVEEAKGLEFDTAVLWMLGDGFETIRAWKDHEAKRVTVHPGRISHELNLAYVAVTRARDCLICFTASRAESLWSLPPFERHLVAVDGFEAAAGMIRSPASSEDWAIQGAMLLERRFFEQAAECYEMAGRPEKVWFCKAVLSESAGDNAAAALAFMKAGIPLRAAWCHEVLGNFERAADLYEMGGELLRAMAIRAEWFFRSGRFSEAGDLFEVLGRLDRAGRCHRASGDPIKAFHLLRKAMEEEWSIGSAVGRTSRAVSSNAGEALVIEAVDCCFEALARWGSRPEALERPNHEARKVVSDEDLFPEVLRNEMDGFIDSWGSRDQAIRWLETGERHCELALRYEKTDDFVKALRSLEKAVVKGQVSKEDLLFRARSRKMAPGSKAIRLHVAGQSGMAAKACRKAGLKELEREILLDSGDPETILKTACERKDSVAAIGILALSGKPWHELYNLINQHIADMGASRQVAGLSGSLDPLGLKIAFARYGMARRMEGPRHFIEPAMKSSLGLRRYVESSCDREVFIDCGVVSRAVDAFFARWSAREISGAAVMSSFQTWKPDPDDPMHVLYLALTVGCELPIEIFKEVLRPLSVIDSEFRQRLASENLDIIKDECVMEFWTRKVGAARFAERRIDYLAGICLAAEPLFLACGKDYLILTYFVEMIKVAKMLNIDVAGLEIFKDIPVRTAELEGRGNYLAAAALHFVAGDRDRASASARKQAENRFDPGVGRLLFMTGAIEEGTAILCESCRWKDLRSVFEDICTLSLIMSHSAIGSSFASTGSSFVGGILMGPEEWRRAAEVLESFGHYETAAWMWATKCGDSRGASRCLWLEGGMEALAWHYEGASSWDMAAALFARAGKYNRAMIMCIRAKNFPRAADCLELCRSSGLLSAKKLDSMARWLEKTRLRNRPEQLTFCYN